VVVSTTFDVTSKSVEGFRMGWGLKLTLVLASDAAFALPRISLICLLHQCRYNCNNILYELFSGDVIRISSKQKQEIVGDTSAM